MAKKLSYEEMREDLESILSKLESNELNLEEAMKEYEKGIKLVNKLYKTLNTFEGKVTVIRDEEEMEFDENNED